MTRERQLTSVFVELADTLVVDFDVVDFLHLLTERCVELLEIDEAGIVLLDQSGRLKLVAASSGQTRLLEMFQLENEEGPCLDCYTLGTPVSSVDLRADAGRWPTFAAAARRRGFAAVQALPMRLRDQVLGSLNLFMTSPRALDADSVALGRGLADIATIGLISERVAREQTVLSEQLQTALNSRVLIEQAKGMIAERAGISVDQAFAAIRAHARNSNRKLTEVAAEIAQGEYDPAVLGRSVRE